MSLRINNSNISQIKINGVNIQLAKINGSIVFEINGEIITLNFNDKTISAISNKSGSYDFYYAKDGEILEEYDKIVSFDLKANVTSSYTYLNSFNIAPYNANEIAACKSGTTNILSSSSLPSQFLFDSTTYGDKLYSFGALSDVHIDGDETDEASASGDFAKALNYFNSKASLVAISGDLSINNGYSELSMYKDLVDANASIPVYASRGNHDCRYSISDFETYTGGSLYFEQTYNNDKFIFLGMNAENYGDSCFTTEELSWLETKLENYKNQRVFLFFHVFMPNTCGNINDLYPYSSLNSSSSNITKFINLMTIYKNVIYFSGHSHLEFDLQRLGKNANIFSDGSTCHRIHIPSCAKPRKNSSGTSSTDTYDYNEGSEGYLVDVYENCIVLRGRDFEKGKFLPIANYLLDTTIINIDEETTTNLFDWENAPVLNAYVSTSSYSIKAGTDPKLTYLAIEPNTTYKVEKQLGVGFSIATTTDVPAVGVTVNQKTIKPTATSLTVTTSTNDKYLAIYYHDKNDTITEEEMRKSIVVTKVETGNEETILVSNYSPNGSTFTHTVNDIDWSTDEIEASIDLSTCSSNNENILSIGADIANWSGYNLHCYYTPNNRSLQMNLVDNEGEYGRATKTLSDNNLNIKLNNMGLYVNDEIVTNWTDDVSDRDIATEVKEYLENQTTIYIGSQEGSTRSNATYNYIKIVRG